MTASNVAQLSRELERFEPSEIVAWVWKRFGSSAAVAASFQDCVLIDVVARVAPDFDVLFLDTGQHFPETLGYVEQVRRRYSMKLQVVGAGKGPDDQWSTDATSCCASRKVGPLFEALLTRRAWLSGVRRADSAARATTPVLAYDAEADLLKVNPLVCWADSDVEGYISARSLPRYPLTALGYTSIGCSPCTELPPNPADPRSGRWSGSTKTECGLHVSSTHAASTIVGRSPRRPPSRVQR